jgi:hypothetical protein
LYDEEGARTLYNQHCSAEGKQENTSISGLLSSFPSMTTLAQVRIFFPENFTFSRTKLISINIFVRLCVSFSFFYVTSFFHVILKWYHNFFFRKIRDSRTFSWPLGPLCAGHVGFFFFFSLRSLLILGLGEIDETTFGAIT